ncbi:hypothetical protein BDB01DRAFT_792659 [Pilobolus umbonatus]|nr:hypothetical protein BDB01DRAFT_792659 [Pilobolus umbonatus]
MFPFIKPYLRRLIVQTHPDFFHQDPLRKQTNANSLQTLNNILQSNQRTPPKVTVSFYLKKNRRKPITSQIINESEWTLANSFLQLCKQVDIPVLQSDKDLVQDMLQKENRKTVPVKSVKKDFADKLHKQFTSTRPHQWTANDIMNNPLIMFDADVNKADMIHKLTTWIPELEPNKWWGKIPVLVLSSPVDNELCRGMIVLDPRMDLSDLKHYFQMNLDRIMKEHDNK